MLPVYVPETTIWLSPSKDYANEFYYTRGSTIILTVGFAHNYKMVSIEDVLTVIKDNKFDKIIIDGIQRFGYIYNLKDFVNALQDNKYITSIIWNIDITERALYVHEIDFLKREKSMFRLYIPYRGYEKYNNIDMTLMHNLEEFKGVVKAPIHINPAEAELVSEVYSIENWCKG